MSSEHQHSFTGTVYLAADHAGYEMKEFVKSKLDGQHCSIVDLGAHTYDAKDNYPGLVRPVGQKVSLDTHARALVFGGSGQGEAIVLNRLPKVRAAVFYGPRNAVAEIDTEKSSPAVDGYDAVRLARSHNDANVLSIGARFMTHEEALHAALLFLGTPFSGTERHLARIKEIDD